MTIKRKLTAVSVLLIVLFLFMGIVNRAGTNSIMHTTLVANKLEEEMRHLQGIFRGINEFIIDEGEPLSIKLTKRHVAEFEEVHNTLMASLKDSELKQTLSEKIDPQWKTVKASVISFIKDNPYISVEDNEAMMKYGQLTVKAKNLLEDVESLSEKAQQTAEETSRNTLNIMNIAAAIIISVTSLLLFALYRSINSPINELNVIAEGFGNGNFSILANESRKDEFGILASHFNKATAGLGSIILNVKKVAFTLASNSEELSSSAARIADNAGEQSLKTTQAATAMEELSTSFVDVARNTANAAGSAGEAAELAVKGGEVVTEAMSGINKISESVNESANIIEALGKRSEEIGEIVKVINDIADQTNLLALNAAIEAARAGEQGRGFAVVADEVRKLAERTTRATDEIGGMIKGIQDDTNMAVESMQTGTIEVKDGVNLVNHAGDSLKHIVASIQNVTDMVHQIATAAEEQSSTGEEISLNLDSVADITKQTAIEVQNSSESTQTLYALAWELQKSVSRFKLRNGKNSGDQFVKKEKAQIAMHDAD